MTATQPRPTAGATRPARGGFARFVDEDYAGDVRALGAFRICFGLFTLWLGPPPIRGLVDLPDATYSPPPGLSQIWGGWPPEIVLVGLDVAWIALAVAVTLGWRTRVSSAALTVVTVVSSSILFSTGKIDHTVFTALLPLFCGLAGWGDALSLDERRRAPRAGVQPTSRSWPLATLAGLLAVGFFTAAMPKIAGGWLDPGSQAAERYFRDDLLLRDRTDLLAPAAARIDSAIAWELLDIGTVAFELGIAIAVLNTLWFRRGLMIAVGFHIGVLMVMNISFLALPLLYAALLVPGLTASTTDRFAGLIAANQRRLWLVALALAVVNLHRPPTAVLVDLLDVGSLPVRAGELIAVSAGVVWLGVNQRSRRPAAA